MTWKSRTFISRDNSGRFDERVASASSRHKEAMQKIVENARELSRERESVLKNIRDPQLRKSAAR